MATVTNKTKVLSIKGKVKAILQVENEKRMLTCVGNMVLYIRETEQSGKTGPKLLVCLNRPD